ncbi:hypothetical protein APHAL10511_006605 [Amanita phalloides]|nr:hypothetical protein APHAL10511_006605 [Amanita phalloides]
MSCSTLPGSQTTAARIVQPHRSPSRSPPSSPHPPQAAVLPTLDIRNFPQRCTRVAKISPVPTHQAIALAPSTGPLPLFCSTSACSARSIFPTDVRQLEPGWEPPWTRRDDVLALVLAFVRDGSKKR